MQTTITEYHCDICKQKILNPEENHHVVEVVIDGQSYQFDWDSACINQLMNNANGGNLACDHPGCGFVAKTVSGLGVHQHRKHG